MAKRWRRSLLCYGQGDIGFALLLAAAATDPLAVATPVIVAVEGQAIAVWAEGRALGIVPALEAGPRVVIVDLSALIDQPEGVEVIVDEGEHLVESLTRIGE